MLSGATLLKKIRTRNSHVTTIQTERLLCILESFLSISYFHQVQTLFLQLEAENLSFGLFSIQSNRTVMVDRRPPLYVLKVNLFSKFPLYIVFPYYIIIFTLYIVFSYYIIPPLHCIPLLTSYSLYTSISLTTSNSLTR